MCLAAQGQAVRSGIMLHTSRLAVTTMQVTWNSVPFAAWYAPRVTDVCSNTNTFQVSVQQASRVVHAMCHDTNRQTQQHTNTFRFPTFMTGNRRSGQRGALLRCHPVSLTA